MRKGTSTTTTSIGTSTDRTDRTGGVGAAAAALSLALAMTAAFVGCNSILDNQPGALATDDESTALPTETAPVVTPDAATAIDATPIPGEDAGPGENGCAAGERMCDGSCVRRDDPMFGCGDAACQHCPGDHATMACRAGRCAVALCDKGFADCNAQPGDGCETDLSRPAHCGACELACGGTTPICVPNATSHECTNGCTTAAPLRCGAECVDSTTSINHCGGCDVQCPTVANSTTTCTDGACGFVCKAQFNRCNGKCVTRTDVTACGTQCLACAAPINGRATCAANACGFTCDTGFNKCGTRCTAPNDPTACGAACAVCPARDNAAPTCAAGVCNFACNAGFASCDAKADNGCETNLQTDPLNCGACGVSCGAQACVAGVCAAPPPPPPPPPPVP